MAEEYLEQQGAWVLRPRRMTSRPIAPRRHRRAAASTLRCGGDAGDRRDARGRPDRRVRRSCRPRRPRDRGPITPDHVIRTKQLPLVGRDVDTYVAAYDDFFERNEVRSADADHDARPGPTHRGRSRARAAHVGRTVSDTAVTATSTGHTIDAVERAAALETGVPFPRRPLRRRVLGASNRPSCRSRAHPSRSPARWGSSRARRRASAVRLPRRCSEPARRSSGSTSTPASTEPSNTAVPRNPLRRDRGRGDRRRARAAAPSPLRRPRRARAQRRRVPGVEAHRPTCPPRSGGG